MKYIRTYGDYNSWKLDYSNPDRGFRLKPTLYKYSDTNVESKILLENDDPRKHGDSTYMEITLDSDTEFGFRICPSSAQPMSYTIDWGDGTVETKTAELNIEGDPGFGLSHNYKRGSYKIELYDVERNYIIPGHSYFENGFIYPTSSVKRVILSKDGVAQNMQDFDYDDYCAFKDCTNLTSIYIPKGAVRIGSGTFYGCSSLKSINIPEGVTSIWNRGSYSTFQGCTSLTSIIIPASVTSIEGGEYQNGVFSECRNLKTISSFNTTAPTLGSSGISGQFNGLPTNGTLYIKPGATGYDAWLSALPSGWKIVESL